MVRRPARAVVNGVDGIQGKRAKRAGCLTHCKIELVRAGECPSFWVLSKGQYDVEPALRRLIEVAAWIGRKGAKDTSGAVDGRWKAVERVEGGHISEYTHLRHTPLMRRLQF